MQQITLDEPAELVFRGGVVHCLDDAETTGAALAVRHGRIARVGESAAMDDLIGPETRIVELDGRAVIPGINDSHLHAAWLGAMWPATVFGADPQVAAPDEDGPPLVSTPSEKRAAIIRAGELIASLGITSYTEPGLGPGEDNGATGCFGQSVFDEYLALEAEGALRARVTVLMLFGELDGPSTLADFLAGVHSMRRSTDRPEWLRVAGVKIFADGIPPAHQAWTHHTYPDGTSGGLLVDGLDIVEQESNLRRMVLEAHQLGFQVGVHATGDRSIEVAVDAVSEAMAGTESANERRHYVIHGDLANSETLAAMARLGVGLNVQPGIAVKTSPWLAGVLGEETTTHAWPIADAIAAGVSVSLSSDAPVLSPDWRQAIADADEWMGAAPPSERGSRMRSLLRAYTLEPARQDCAEQWKGTLESGKVADLCVLGTDPLSISPAELPGVSVDLTVVDGRVVFERVTAPVPG